MKKIIIIVLMLSISSIFNAFSQIKIAATDSIIPKVKEEKFSKMPSLLEFRNIVGLNGWANVLIRYSYVDITPTMSYKLNERTHIGAGLSFRYFRNFKYPGKTDDYMVYGGRVFLRYRFVYNVFLQAEYEYLYGLPQLRVMNSKNYEIRDWIGAPLIGGAYRGKLLHQVFGLMTVLLNPSYDKKLTPEATPFVVRFGLEYEF
jgi:hypothetical protein